MTEKQLDISFLHHALMDFDKWLAMEIVIVALMQWKSSTVDCGIINAAQFLMLFCLRVET